MNVKLDKARKLNPKINHERVIFHLPQIDGGSLGPGNNGWRVLQLWLWKRVSWMNDKGGRR